jgi:hypothetical protein
MGKEIKTPGNIKFGDMPAEYRMKFLKLKEEELKKQEEKQKKKEEEKLKKLYNKSNHGGNK